MDITAEIKRLSKQYRYEYQCKSWDINNGLCVEFAEDMEKSFPKLVEEDKLVVLLTDMFLCAEDEAFAKEHWGDLVYTEHGIWGKKMLDLYGTPKNLERIDYVNNHGWIYYEGKHYDAECPRGVKYWYQLPIFKSMRKK